MPRNEGLFFPALIAGSIVFVFAVYVVSYMLFSSVRSVREERVTTYSTFSKEEVEYGKVAGVLIWKPPLNGAPFVVPTDKDIEEIRIVFKKR